jgi:hypothetical protein
MTGVSPGVVTIQLVQPGALVSFDVQVLKTTLPITVSCSNEGNGSPTFICAALGRIESTTWMTYLNGTVAWSAPHGLGSFNETSCTLKNGACYVEYTAPSGSILNVTASFTGPDAYPSSETVTVEEGSSQLNVLIGIEPQEINLGESITLTADATGGSGHYSYSWTVLPSGCFGTTRTVVCEPFDEGQSQTIEVQVTDTVTGQQVSAQSHVDVFPPLTAKITEEPDSIDLGDDTQITVAATGSGYYTYDWLQLPNGCPGSMGDTIDCTPANAGKGQPISVQVTDTVTGKQITRSDYIDVYKSDFEVGLSFQYDNKTGTGNFQVIPITGMPYVDYQWAGLPESCPNLNSPTILCGVIAPDNYDVLVTVTNMTEDQGVAEYNATINSGEIGFVERGLPAGQRWTVVLGTPVGILSQNATAGVPIDFDDLPTTGGTYAFAVSPTGGYVPVPRTGGVTPGGAYEIRFVNTMPRCTPMNVTIGTNSTITASSKTSIASNTTSMMPTNSTLEIGVCSGVLPTQITGADLKNDPNGTSVLSFNMTGKTGSMAYPVIKVPKSDLTGERAPTVYVNHDLVLSSYFEDRAYYYVWFTVHFSTDQISFVFAAQPSTSTTSGQGGGVSPSGFLGMLLSPSFAIGGVSVPILLVVVLVVVVFVAVALAARKRRRRS